MEKYAGGKGNENINWKGGVAEYPDHSELKRNRIKKLKEADGKCEVCHEDAFCVHHLDGSKANHDMKNLAVLCKKCHLVLHNDTAYPKSTAKTSKYTREYGMTLKEMAERYGGCDKTYLYQHKKGTLHRELDKLKASDK